MGLKQPECLLPHIILRMSLTLCDLSARRCGTKLRPSMGVCAVCIPATGENIARC
jgi:hypothetical protein